MTGTFLHLVDVTDVLRHFLATKELSGIPRVLVTIIEGCVGRHDVEFCVFDERDERFLVIGNRRSIDVAVLDQYDFPKETDNLDIWIEKFSPDLRPVEFCLGGRQVHYCLISSQWDSLPERGGFAQLDRLLEQEHVTVLHHDSYVSDSASDNDRARRFVSYWSMVASSPARIIYISDHSKKRFEDRFGPSERSVIAHYDFALSYPRTGMGVSQDAVDLATADGRYLLVFAVIDGRKSPIPLIEKLVAAGLGKRYRIVLIVRFAINDRYRHIELMELALMHRLKVFLSPNDATYLWLIRYAHAVFYPSIHEGFGLVPFDCKQFGKACYLPAGADYAYLHDNIVTYDLESELDVSNPPAAVNNLPPFPLSSFMQTLFTPAV